MEAAAWHLIRRGLTEKARAERNENMGAMPPLQAAITERAIRELWDRVEALEAKPVDPALLWTCPAHGERVITRMYSSAGSCPECKGADLKTEAKRGPGRPPKGSE